MNTVLYISPIYRLITPDVILQSQFVVHDFLGLYGLLFGTEPDDLRVTFLDLLVQPFVVCANFRDQTGICVAHKSAALHQPLIAASSDFVVGGQSGLNVSRRMYQLICQKLCNESAIFNRKTGSITVVRRGRVCCISDHGDASFEEDWQGIIAGVKDSPL